MRAAYEKLRRVSATTRRGRVPGVPVEIYHDLDNLTRRMDGMAAILGISNDAIGLASSSPLITRTQAVPEQEVEPSLTENLAILNLAPDMTAGDYTGFTLIASSAYDFIIQSISVFYTAETGSTSYVDFDMFIGGSSVFGRALPVTTIRNIEGANGVVYRFLELEPNMIVNHDTAISLGLPLDTKTKGRRFAAKAPIYASVERAGYSLQVYVQMAVTQIVQVG